MNENNYIICKACNKEVHKDCITELNKKEHIFNNENKIYINTYMCDYCINNSNILYVI